MGSPPEDLQARADHNREKAADLRQRANYFATQKEELEALARDYQEIADQFDDLARWKSHQ